MNIKNGGIDLSLTQRFADRVGFEKENPRTRITKGDIILGIIGGSIGNAAIYQHNVEVIAQRSIAIIETLYLNEYSYWAIQSPLFFSYYSGASGTAQGGVYLGSIASMLLPVPPMAEQERIVSRITDLLKVIDDYGALEGARERLDTELPERLRKSILQLAVQGKLVKQNPADESASVLLERIRTERAALVKTSKLKAPKGGESVIYRASDGGYYEKRGKGDPVCIDDEIPFDIPESWEWLRLESIMALSSGLGYKKPDLAIESDRMIRVLRGGNISIADEIIMHDSDVFIAEQFVDPSLLLRPGQLITPAVTSLENVGKAALVRDSIPDTVCGGFVFFLTPFLEEPWLSEYLYLWFIAPDHRAFCKACVKKSGQAFYNLSKASLNSALIALPPMEEQKRISQACRKLLTQLTNQ